MKWIIREILKKVTGDTGADGTGYIATNEKINILIGQFNVTYSTFQIYGTTDPTICELFFYLHSEKVCNYNVVFYFLF